MFFASSKPWLSESLPIHVTMARICIVIVGPRKYATVFSVNNT